MAYKILWYSIPSLLDSSSGAAIRCKFMLEQLSKRDIEIKVLNAAVVDDPQGLNAIKQVRAQLQPNVAINEHSCFYQFNYDGLEYFIHNTKSTEIDDLQAREQTELFLFFTKLLEIFKPDLIMTYSADIFSTVMRAEAHARGIPVVYALCNGSHTSFGFSDCDVVFTTSQATSSLYKEKCNIDVAHIGNFIDASKVIAPAAQRKPTYITEINPRHAYLFFDSSQKYFCILFTNLAGGYDSSY